VRSEVQVLPGPPAFAAKLRRLPRRSPPGRRRAWPRSYGSASQEGLDGAVAQLGERLLCKQEVIGSIPFSSTRAGRFRKGNWFGRKFGHGAFLASGLLASVLCSLTLWIGLCGRPLAGSLAGVIPRALIAWAGREEVLSMPFVALDGRGRLASALRFGERIKRLRAFGECLGTERR
jgi:hypothetical protein